MDTVPCPGCAAPLKVDQEVCGACRRPRDEIEIEQGRESLRERERLRRRRPRIAAALILAAVAAGALFRERARLLPALASSRAELVGRAEVASALSRSAPPSPVPPAGLAAMLVQMSGASQDKPAPRDDEGEKDLPLPLLEATRWAVYGRVYDLLTLRPVPNAKLNFMAQTKDGPSGGYSTQSDEYGRYFVKLTHLVEGSYEIRSSNPAYTATVFYEIDIPYARLPPQERRDLVRSAQDGDVALPALNEVADETYVRRDLYLAPHR